MRRQDAISWPEALAGITLGIFLSQTLPFLLRRLNLFSLRHNPPQDDSDMGSEVSSEELPHTNSGDKPRGEHKLVLCVRTDLKMTRGKIAAQVGHATLGAYKRASRRNVDALKYWEYNAQPKIAVGFPLLLLLCPLS